MTTKQTKQMIDALIVELQEWNVNATTNLDDEHDEAHYGFQRGAIRAREEVVVKLQTIAAQMDAPTPVIPFHTHPLTCGKCRAVLDVAAEFCEKCAPPEEPVTTARRATPRIDSETLRRSADSDEWAANDADDIADAARHRFLMDAQRQAADDADELIRLRQREAEARALLEREIRICIDDECFGAAEKDSPICERCKRFRAFLADGRGK